MPHLTYDRYDTELQAETARFAAAVQDADPTHPVPTCPAWTLAQLTEHVGFGHRWAAVIIERRATKPVPHDQADDLQVPKDADERSTWLVAGARRLADAVRQAGPATHVWTWADDQTAGFWLRRITHDTLVHRLDAELAEGRPISALAPDMAADSVSDLLEMFSILPRIDDFPALSRLRGHGQTLHFHATDPGLGLAGEWLAHRRPSGVEWEHRHAEADATLRGPALDLLLVLSRRAAADTSRLEASGDPDLLAPLARAQPTGARLTGPDPAHAPPAAPRLTAAPDGRWPLRGPPSPEGPGAAGATAPPGPAR